MIPDNDPDLVEAAKWLKKFDDPMSPTGRLVRAYRTYEPGVKKSSRPFDPMAVLEQYRATGDKRMERLVKAVKLLPK